MIRFKTIILMCNMVIGMEGKDAIEGKYFISGLLLGIEKVECDKSRELSIIDVFAVNIMWAL